MWTQFDPLPQPFLVSPASVKVGSYCGRRQWMSLNAVLCTFAICAVCLQWLCFACFSSWSFSLCCRAFHYSRRQPFVIIDICFLAAICKQAYSIFWSPDPKFLRANNPWPHQVCSACDLIMTLPWSLVGVAQHWEAWEMAQQSRFAAPTWLTHNTPTHNIPTHKYIYKQY